MSGINIHRLPHDEIVRLWNDGHARADIARKMRCVPSAVDYALTRPGAVLTRQPNKGTTERISLKAKRVQPFTIRESIRMDWLPIPFISRREGSQCAYVVGDPMTVKASEITCCGQPTEGGKNWCQAHLSAVYTPRQPKPLAISDRIVG